MQDELARARAIDSLRYASAGQQLGLFGGACAVCGSTQDEEVEKLVAEQGSQQRAWRRQANRQQALGHTLALGRRYDNADEAIADAVKIAAWLGLDLE